LSSDGFLGFHGLKRLKILYTLVGFLKQENKNILPSRWSIFFDSRFPICCFENPTPFHFGSNCFYTIHSLLKDLEKISRIKMFNPQKQIMLTYFMNFKLII